MVYLHAKIIYNFLLTLTPLFISSDPTLGFYHNCLGKKCKDNTERCIAIVIITIFRIFEVKNSVSLNMGWDAQQHMAAIMKKALTCKIVITWMRMF